MNKRIAGRIALLVLLGMSWFSEGQVNVVFGAAGRSRPSVVCFDRNGFLYPGDNAIPDTGLLACGASLRDWYRGHPDYFLRLCREHGCPATGYTDAHADALNDSLIAHKARQINGETRGQPVCFLVHGYRKPLVSAVGTYSSPEDFAFLEHALRPALHPGTLTVQVYWDGLYCNPSRQMQMYRSFEEAQRRAPAIGSSLRRLLGSVRSDTIHLLTHSLGARIAAEALFNLPGSDASVPTSTARCVNICLIAPALPGVELFRDYHRRSTALPFQTADNYRLAIAYNEHDFVLLKKLAGVGPGPYRYGNTTLGCNYDGAAVKLQAYFAAHFPRSPFRLIDMSGVGRCHFVKCYTGASSFERVNEFLKGG